MAKAISLLHYYNRSEAFKDPDPMIRIAAIHRAGSKLEHNDALRQTLRTLLNDRDVLVARYTAITLAQSGDRSGIQYLLQAVCCAKGPDRDALDACLRNCARFPFAVLLNEYLFVETISSVKDEGCRRVLLLALQLTSDDFYQRTESDASFRYTFLKTLRTLEGVAGLRVRDEKILDLGHILSVPARRQAGFLFCPDRRLFLKFQEETVLNRGYMERGRQVLFVGCGDRVPKATCLYVLEDEPSCCSIEISRNFEGVSSRSVPTYVFTKMVLDFLESHERIRRKDVCELCGINESQATYLLGKLRRNGTLELVNGVYYVGRDKNYSKKGGGKSRS
jgi:hypothetical protein